MDMPFNTLTLAQSGALRRILDRVASGRDALVDGDGDGHALLDAAAERLAALRQRAIRVSVPPAGLSLSGLMAAITGRPDLLMQDDAVLELGFRILTVRDEACDGIVLLVSGADRLQRPAFRYIQFACRAGKDLRVMLAGARLGDALTAPELAALRTRLADDAAPAPAVVKPVAAAPAPPALPAAPIRPASVEPAPVQPAPAKAAPAPAAPPVSTARVRPAVSSRAGASGNTRRVAWAAGMGVAASLALGLWAAHSPSPPSNGHVAAASAIPVQLAPAAPAVASVPPPVIAATAMPAEPAPAAAPPVAASPEPAAPMEAALPVPSPVAAPPRAAARRPDTRAREAAPVQSVSRRPTPAQPRFERMERPPAPLDEDRHPAPPRARQTEDTFGPMYSTLAQPRSFIGTYSANPDGTRAFRMEP